LSLAALARTAFIWALSAVLAEAAEA